MLVYFKLLDAEGMGKYIFNSDEGQGHDVPQYVSYSVAVNSVGHSKTIFNKLLYYISDNQTNKRQRVCIYMKLYALSPPPPLPKIK